MTGTCRCGKTKITVKPSPWFISFQLGCPICNTTAEVVNVPSATGGTEAS